jgi:sec-independent protein translocase protein TatB
MFDIGFLEIAVVLVVALVVIGPERMPEVARTVGKYVGKFRYFVAKMREETDFDRHAGNLRREIEQAAGSEELKGLSSGLTRSMSDIKDVVNPSDFMLSEAEMDKLESGSYRNRYVKGDDDWGDEDDTPPASPAKPAQAIEPAKPTTTTATATPSATKTTDKPLDSSSLQTAQTPAEFKSPASPVKADAPAISQEAKG